VKSMRQTGPLLTASMWIILVGTSACSAESSSEKSPSSTEVVTIAPLDESGEPRSDYEIIHEMREVDCHSPSPSAVDPDIVWCGTTADSTDVCWVKPDRTSLFCGVSPWDAKIRELYSAEKVQKTDPEANPVPWAMELDDGDKCQRRIGGAGDPLPFELLPAYYCKESGRTIVRGPGVKLLDKSSGKWTVQVVDGSKAGKDGEGYQLPPRVSVNKVYFAGQSS
jgi:hypothetical protein